MMRKRKADRNIGLKNKIFFVAAVLCAVCALCKATYAALSGWQEDRKTLLNENIITDIVRDNTVPERNRPGFSKNNSLTCELTEKQLQAEDMAVLYGGKRIIFTKYSNHSGTNDIEVDYPKLQEIEGIDVQKINSLIENDLMRIFDNNQLYNENN